MGRRFGPPRILHGICHTILTFAYRQNTFAINSYQPCCVILCSLAFKQFCLAGHLSSIKPILNQNRLKIIFIRDKVLIWFLYIWVYMNIFFGVEKIQMWPNYKIICAIRGHKRSLLLAPRASK